MCLHLLYQFNELPFPLSNPEQVNGEYEVSGSKYYLTWYIDLGEVNTCTEGTCTEQIIEGTYSYNLGYDIPTDKTRILNRVRLYLPYDYISATDEEGNNVITSDEQIISYNNSTSGSYVYNYINFITENEINLTTPNEELDSVNDEITYNVSYDADVNYTGKVSLTSYDVLDKKNADNSLTISLNKLSQIK